MGNKKSISSVETYSLISGWTYDIKDLVMNPLYHIQYMMDRTCQIFKYKNLPEEIYEKHLELKLQQGYVIAPKNKIYNPQTGKEEYMVFGKDDATFSGLLNANKEPTNALITNAYLNISNEYSIPDDAIVIFNDSSHIGLMPMLSKYGLLLTHNELTIYINDIMKRIQLLLTASTDKEKLECNKFINNIIKGELGSIKGSRFSENGKSIESLPTNSSGMAHTLTELIEMEQYLKASELNELGLDANYNMKRESLNKAESNLNKDSLLPLVQNMLDERKRGIDKLNKLWGTNISVDFSPLWKVKENEIIVNKDGENDEKSNINDGGGENDSDNK